MSYADLIEQYLRGPELLQQAVAGMSEAELDAVPIPGAWSTRQVVCHIADFEPIYADRMKRVIAEDEPTFFSGDPDVFARSLAYPQRQVDEELQLIAVTRQQMGRILRTLSDADFHRAGNHSEDGRMELHSLLSRITGHIPHHVRFIEEKRKALK